MQKIKIENQVSRAGKTTKRKVAATKDINFTASSSILRRPALHTKDVRGSRAK